MAWITAGLLCVLGQAALARDSAERDGAAPLPLIALIIDDIGYRQAQGLRAIELPGAVSYSILPFTPFATSLAEHAHRRGKEVLLHLPMESMDGTTLEPTTLMVDMSWEELDTQLEAALRAVPHSVGLSNHMGSLFTTSLEHMRWLMQSLRREREGMYFVDSRTAPASKALWAAREHGVAAVSRDVFLDHSDDRAQIRRQWHELLAHARHRGSALGIAHPKDATLDVLERELGELSRYGVRLVSIGELVRHRRGPIERISPGWLSLRARHAHLP